MGTANFPFAREFGGFGFGFGAQPSLDRAQVRDLATGRFITNGDALLLLGPPSIGKTHLAVALAREAIVAGTPCSSPARWSWWRTWTPPKTSL